MTDFPLEREESATEVIRETRPWYWSVRREIWENRSIYMAPVIVAGLFMFGYLISLIALPRRMREAQAMDVWHQRARVEMPYDMIAAFIIITAFVVGIFYCADALNSERRDRSILFWKSLPVSDFTTVMSKIAIPLVVLPVYAFAVIVITQFIMFCLNNMVLLGNGRSLAILWTQYKFVQAPIALLYCLICMVLWHAPFYSWFLLVSGWARRATFLWALVPIGAIAFAEMAAFQSHHFLNFVGYRFYGFFPNAVIQEPNGVHHLEPLAALTPIRYLLTPGLWLGLIFAAVCVAITVRMRRYRSSL